MPPARIVTLALALLLPACGHTAAVAAPPADPEPAPSQVAAVAPEPESTPASPAVAVRTITFGDDELDPGPSTPIRSAPKRPPIPSFQLFGTRAGDGP